MKTYKDMNLSELEKLKAELTTDFEEVKRKNLKLDMSRGKPGIEQLELSMGLMNALDDIKLQDENGFDCRNYGILDGIPEAKVLMSMMLDCTVNDIIVYGNSSLNIMYDTIARSMTHGVMGTTPWMKLDKIKFLCPVPGYDRHFAICEHFGIEMVNIPMSESGPDMDLVEKLVSEDESIKGIWCVPKYSNPQGITYTKETVERFAALRPKATDFRIFWDNAYCIHHIYEELQDNIPSILEECKKAGNPDMVYIFGSTSKVTFPGSGVAAMASSEGNLNFVKKQMSIQTIGYDKMNQLRHARFFEGKNQLADHMKKHADLIRPRFKIVLDALEKELKSIGIASWVVPRGGYFISMDTMEGCAKKVVSLCKEAGVVMTNAGATFPYGKDPFDRNIRIAPTFPTTDELVTACNVFILCVKLASVEKLLEQ